MIGRKNQGVFHAVFGNRGSVCSGDVPAKTRHLLSVPDLVGADPVGGFGRGGLVRLAVVERSLWNILGGRQR